MQFAGQVVWITGASAGIGEALAHEFARAGARLALTARRREELERVAADLPASAEPFVLPFDVTDTSLAAPMADQIESRFGRIDVLMNNAGVSQRSLVRDTSLETYRALFEVNVFQAIALTKAVLPGMTARRHGYITVTSSVAGKYATPYRSGYAAAKHAVIGFFDALRAEVAADGIRVSTLVAGSIKTDVSVNALTGDGGRWAKMDRANETAPTAEEAAARIVAGMVAEEPEIEVGRGLGMQLLWLRKLMPRRLFRMMEAYRPV